MRQLDHHWAKPPGKDGYLPTGLGALAAASLLIAACGGDLGETATDKVHTTSTTPRCTAQSVSENDGPNEFGPSCYDPPECEPGETKQCSDGWFDEPKGICEFGTRVCDEDGYWGDCEGFVQPIDELCADGLDNDCDGKLDCQDPDCHQDPECSECEITGPEVCDDGVDNDCDGKTDCEDPDCDGVCDPECEPSKEVCDDGLDNDCDGKIDCEDPDCANAEVCEPVCEPSQEVCDDGIDNDCDGKVDCEDPDCGDTLICNPECEVGDTQSCNAGLFSKPVGVCKNGTRTCQADGSWGECKGAVGPSKEICTDGKDNDCDGKTDCDDTNCKNSSHCLPTCTKITKTETADSYLRDCNTHRGDNERACRAKGNTNRCAPEVFAAWCTRRINNTWKNMHRDWVAKRCNGTVKLTSVKIGGKTYPRYVCEDWKKCVRYQSTTPLVLVFDVDEPVRYHADNGVTQFDLSAVQNGTETRTDWPTDATPWLALDRNGDGEINSGRELFGSATMLSGGAASNGFEALAPLDADGNGKVDVKDPAFKKLVLWFDRNGDRQSQSGELRSLDSVGIISLDVQYKSETRCDARGNCEIERATFLWRDKDNRVRKGAIVDVHLRVRN